jgi:beta-glucanase (GH16 family)
MRMLNIFIAAALPLAIAPAQDGNYKLIWSDEFDGPRGTAPDPAKWVYDTGASGWGNHELEEYTHDPANAFLDGEGNLVIRAIRSESGKYTSARLKTLGRFSFKYGRVEARIRIPRGQGIWPAFWMLGENLRGAGWPTAGEVDVMENIGKEPEWIHGTVHGPGYSGAKGITSRTGLPGGGRISDTFHIFRVDWSPHKIEFYLDNIAYAAVTRDDIPAGSRWVFDHPFFLLLNVAVGGDWPGNPTPDTIFPQSMLVDWVRVWQKPPAGTGPGRALLHLRFDAEGGGSREEGRADAQ